jgi:NTE family protein
VTIAGRRYVDGGMYSNSNLDLVRNERLDLVICLNPTSTLHPLRAWNPIDRAAALVRRASGRRLGSEARKLRAAGTEVVLIQPTGKDLEVMGSNLMSGKRRNEVIQVAIETVAEQLDSLVARDLLKDLPPGAPERVHRPAGPPSEWPRLVPVASLRKAS